MNFCRRVVVCLLPIAFAFGCSGPQAEDLLAQANDSNIKRLANVYVAFQSRNNWRGPTDEKDFKSFLNGWNPKKLLAIGVDPQGIDDIFVSGRDGQPFKVRYGVPGNIMGSTEPVIFESEGMDGLRRVGFLDMTQRDVDEAEYSQLWEGTSQPVSPGRESGR